MLISFQYVLLFYVGKRRPVSFCAAKVQQKNDICKYMPIFCQVEVALPRILELHGKAEAVR